MRGDNRRWMIVGTLCSSSQPGHVSETSWNVTEPSEVQNTPRLTFYLILESLFLILMWLVLKAKSKAWLILRRQGEPLGNWRWQGAVSHQQWISRKEGAEVSALQPSRRDWERGLSGDDRPIEPIELCAAGTGDSDREGCSCTAPKATEIFCKALNKPKLLQASGLERMGDVSC